MKRVYSISKDNLRWIRHSVLYDVDTKEPYPSPSEVWSERGKDHILEWIGEPIGDCVMLLVKDWDAKMEKFEDERPLEPNSNYWANYGIIITE
jgi:hypothetical protein